MWRNPYFWGASPYDARFEVSYGDESELILAASNEIPVFGSYSSTLGLYDSFDMVGVRLQRGATYNMVLSGDWTPSLEIYDNEGYGLFSTDGASLGLSEPYGTDSILAFQPSYTGIHYLGVEWAYFDDIYGQYVVMAFSDDHILGDSPNSPVSGSIVVRGEAARGATLTADTAGLSDANGLGELVYQWLRDGEDIAGANSDSYQLTRSDTGSAISVRVAYYDGDGFLEFLTSDATDAVSSSSTASDGRDTFYGDGESDVFNGLAGIDTLVLPISRSRSDLTLSSDSSNGMVKDGGTSYEFSNIERLQFNDTNIAFDLLNDGHAGQVCKILGAVYGAEAIENPGFVGTGLSLLDGGMSYEGLAEAAINLRGLTDHQDIAELLWTNLVGHAPKNAQVAPYVEMLDSGSLSVGGLVSIAANHELNTQNIDLTGLASTGIEYQLA